MNGPYKMHGKNKMHTKYQSENRKRRECSKDTGVDKSIKIDLRDTGFEDVNWIYLGKERDWWQAIVNIIINLQVPYEVGWEFLTSLAYLSLLKDWSIDIAN